MECPEMQSEDVDDAFMSIMKNNTVLECRMIQLKSFINTLKNELAATQQKIDSERELNRRLSKEADIQQNNELQARMRISNLNQTKQLTAKLCSDLRDQVESEKKRVETTKKFHEDSIKKQLMKWDEYQKMYRTFPQMMQVEEESVKLSLLQIMKKQKQHELDELKKKVKTRNYITEKRYETMKKKVDQLKMSNNQLIKRKESLEKEKQLTLTTIDNRKESLEKSKNDAHAHTTNGINRLGSSYNVSLAVNDASQTSFERERNSLLSFDLPQLPQIQLQQFGPSSRKIRRIDMVDTTLQRPVFSANIISSERSLSRSSHVLNRLDNQIGVRSDRTARILASPVRHSNVNITDLLHAAGSSRQHNKENDGVCGNATSRQRQIVKPLINDAPKSLISDHTHDHRGSTSQNENAENSRYDDDVNERTEMEDDYMDDDDNNNTVHDGNNKREEQVNIDEGNEMNVHADAVCFSSGGADDDNDKPDDDGYYSQSQFSQSQSLSQTNNADTNYSQNSQHVVNKDDFLRGSVSPGPSFSSSVTALKESDAQRSKYFLGKQNNVKQCLPSAGATTDNNRDNASNKVFKSPLPPRPVPSAAASKGGSISSGVSQGHANAGGTFTFLQDKPKSNAEGGASSSSSIKSGGNDDVYKENVHWATSPPSPQINVDSLQSPPDVQMYGESFLNMLSPPDNGRPLMNLGGTGGDAGRLFPDSSEPSMSSSPMIGESARPMNLFGSSQPNQEKSNPSGGFSFTPKLSNTSSFFSMFK